MRNDPGAFYRTLCEKLYIRDVENICKIEDLWKDRSAPKAFDPSVFEVDAFSEEELNELNDQIVWSVSDWIRLFKSSIFRLLQRANSTECSKIFFDKDDSNTLDFVASSANLRAAVFGIDLKSRFDIKAMAGNIIPAIASTNAIAAAMIIVHANNIIIGNSGNYCNAYINYGSKSARGVFSIEQPCQPNPDCHICATDRALLEINIKTSTVKELIDFVLPLYTEELRRLFSDACELRDDFDEEDLCVFEGARLIYDIYDDNGNGQKTLQSLGICDSKFVKIEFGPRRPLLLGILHKEASGAQIQFDCIPPKTLKTSPQEEAASSGEDDLLCFDSSDDHVEIVERSVKKAKISQE